MVTSIGTRTSSMMHALASGSGAETAAGVSTTRAESARPSQWATQVPPPQSGVHTQPPDVSQPQELGRQPLVVSQRLPAEQPVLAHPWGFAPAHAVVT